jgi:hypothetical protein
MGRRLGQAEQMEQRQQPQTEKGQPQALEKQEQEQPDKQK